MNQRMPADGTTMADNIHYGTGRRKTATARTPTLSWGRIHAASPVRINGWA